MYVLVVIRNIIINVFTKYKYDAKSAQNKADINLISSRKGLDIDSEEFKN